MELLNSIIPNSTMCWSMIDATLQQNKTKNQKYILVYLFGSQGDT